MPRNARYVGLDVHKHVIEACFLDEKGKVVERERFNLTRDSLAKFALDKLEKEDQVALEATTNCWAVVRILKKSVPDVFVSNPVLTKAIGSAKLKTDKVDAEMLAQLLRCEFLPLVWQPDEETGDLRSLTTRRVSLVQSRTGVKNRIQSALHQRLIMVPETISSLFSGSGLRWLEETVPGLHLVTRLTIESDLRLLKGLNEEIKVIEEELYKRGWKDPRLKLLVTIPGVDVVVGQTILAAIGDVSRFGSADKAASYFGLTPRTRSSADKVTHGRITKAGKSHSRGLIIQAAWSSIRTLGPLAGFYKKLRKRKNAGIAVVAVARKLVTYAWHMLKNEEPYRYANPVSAGRKLTRLRMLGGGEKKKRKKGVRTQRYTEDGVEITPPLKTVYESENLPAPPAFDELPEGEKKALRKARVVRQIRSLEKPKRRKVQSEKAV